MKSTAKTRRSLRPGRILRDTVVLAFVNLLSGILFQLIVTQHPSASMLFVSFAVNSVTFAVFAGLAAESRFLHVVSVASLFWLLSFLVSVGLAPASFAFESFTNSLRFLAILLVESAVGLGLWSVWNGARQEPPSEERPRSNRGERAA